MEMLGPRQVVAYAKRFGFPEDFPPFLSTALGAAEATLLEMTSALLGVSRISGIRLQPYQVVSVVDREGNVLEEAPAAPREAIRADTAFVMTNLLRGVVAARHRGGRQRARLAAGRQDRHGGRLHRRVVRRLRSRTSPSASGSATTRRSRSATARPAPSRRCRSGSTSCGPTSSCAATAQNPPQFEPPGNIIFVPVDRDDRRAGRRRGGRDQRSVHLRARSRNAATDTH